jgi:GTP-binding protein HflX
VLVGASFGGSLEEAVWSLEELEALTDTAGADAVDRVLQQRDAPDPATYLGKGKAREVVDAANALGADLLIFDDELTPAQGRNLEELAGVNPLAERGLKVVDRTGLILDIFAQHARSSEGKLQVELAQLDYRLPRLRGWGDVLSRMGGGIGTRRGPGETQLETDRRAILRRIRRVRSDLAELERRRRLTRRARLGSGVPVVALVGYTNAGKSTLLRGLTGASVLVEDRLFSTLDPVTRRLELPHGRHAVMTDTVGFVHKLPHQLVDAFHSTLEEVGEATLLLHVVDASRDVERQIAAVDEVLAEIGIGDTAPVLAFNKVDRLTEVEVDKLWGRYPQGTFVSATEGTGLRELRERLADELSRLRIEVSLEIPFERGEVVARVHENGEVLAESYSENGTRLRARLQPEALDELADFLTQAPS